MCERSEYKEGEEVLTLSCIDLRVSMILESMEIIRDLILHCYDNEIGIPYDLKEDIKSFNSRVENYIIDDGKEYDEEE